ncbi:MAG: T9SS type A sorting domain-containing protein [Flavobacteriales bacterium]
MKTNFSARFSALVIALSLAVSSNAQLLGGSCNAPIAISCNITSVIGSTAGVPSDNATSGSSTCFNSVSTGGQMWYSFTASSAQLITLNTCSAVTNFDTYLSVYTGTCGELTCVSSNDDGCGSLKSLVTFNSIEEVTYLIRVGGFSGANGTFELSITCQTMVSGCNNPLADNYDPEATSDDGSCIFSGCTDPNAMNFDQSANEDDGSCEYCNGEGSITALLYVCAFSNGDELNLQIVDSEGNLVIEVSGLFDFQIANYDLCLEAGECYTAIMNNSYGLDGWYNGYFWINSGNVQIINEALNADASEETAIFSIDGTCANIYGCIDPEADNYNPDANADDGSCIYSTDCEGLTNITISITPGIFPNEVSFTIVDESGIVVFISSPILPNQNNFASLCLPDGCYTVMMYDSFGDGWNNALLVISYNGIATTYTLNTGTTGVGYFSINTEGCDTSVNSGCTDPNADNYDETALLDDGSCEYSGCTDPNAINYNAQATTDDGSCEYCNGEGSVLATLYVCTFSNGSQVELVITDDEGNVVAEVAGLSNGQIYYETLCLMQGVCYTATMINNTGPFGWYNGYFWINAGGVQIINASPDANAASQSIQFSIDGTCGPIAGCTDPNASNFNPDATLNDGSCIYPAYGCTDELALNYNPNATEDDGSCLYPEDCESNLVAFSLAEGIWSNESSYYVVAADGSIAAQGAGAGTVYACLEDGCYTVYMYDSFGDGWVSGGPLTVITNNEILATINLASGTYGETTFGINAEGCVIEVLGCTDPAALNYNPLANTDDGSCSYSEDCTDNLVYIVISTQIWGSEVSWTLANEAGEVVAEGDGYGSWNTSTQYACLPTGCYTLQMNDSWGDGWNGAYYMIYGNGIYAEGTLLYGSSATDLIGIGTTCSDVDGCTDPEAINYNPAATLDDGSCFYNGNTPDGGEFGGFAGQTLGIAMYPNPSSDFVIVNMTNLSNMDAIQLSILSADGKLVWTQNVANEQTTRMHEVDVNDLESGYYMLMVVNGASSKVTPFIKQ